MTISNPGNNLRMSVYLTKFSRCFLHYATFSA